MSWPLLLLLFICTELFSNDARSTWSIKSTRKTQERDQVLWDIYALLACRLIHYLCPCIRIYLVIGAHLIGWIQFASCDEYDVFFLFPQAATF